MIAVCPNPFRDNNLEITYKTVQLLNSEGFITEIFKVFDDDDKIIQSKADEIEFAVVIGGDGTILHVANVLFGTNIPIIGVNLGTMGFMASIEPADISVIPRLIKDGYRESVRMMLDVELFRGEELIYSGTCLNDAVIHGYGDVINTNSYNNGVLISSVDGDGLILSTPTGSTGYSMSAGGPIVEPEARAIIITPICAHSLIARTLVLSHDRVIEVVTQRLRGRKAYLSVDGIFITNLCNNDKLVIKESKHSTIIASMDNYSFFDTAYEKLC